MVERKDHGFWSHTYCMELLQLCALARDVADTFLAFWLSCVPELASTSSQEPAVKFSGIFQNIQKFCKTVA